MLLNLAHSVFRLCCLVLLTLHMQFGFAAQAEPVCPTLENTPFPDYADIGENPRVAVWHDLPATPASCISVNQINAKIVVAMAATFDHSGTLADIAAKAGAISALQDLTYWSVTDNSWRKLISTSIALRSSDSRNTRPDFTADEVLGGNTLYFAQNDTRTWGTNTYSFSTVSLSATRVAFKSENISRIRLGPITLFKPGSIQNLVILSQIDKTTWSYYSLVSIRDSLLAANEKSLINRQAAAFRFLIGQPADREPPVAR